MLPYGRQWIGEEEIRSASETLASERLTQGPRVTQFENAFARRVGSRFAVAFANGTLALAGACQAAGLGLGDEVLLPPLTFVATASAVLYTGATPVFVDIDPRTGNLDPDLVSEKVTSRTRAILAVDYAGHPCEYSALRELSQKHGLVLIADAAHALGASYRGQPVGALADLTSFSFHPVKHITTGEGGMVTTDRQSWAEALCCYREHGIVRDPARMTRNDGPWYYEVHSLGINGRLTDFQCAIGVEQLQRLDGFVARRRAIADRYHRAFASRGELFLPEELPDARSSYHLYVVRLVPGKSPISRRAFFEKLRSKNLGVQVHYLPVPDHPYYRNRFGDQKSRLPESFRFYENCLSLPCFPAMSDEDVQTVIRLVQETLDEGV
jgi:perosamine synthetase